MAQAHLISVDGGGLPRGYELAPGEELVVETAVATFDGTGAAGDFLPAVAFYSQNGSLIGRVFADTTLTTGDSAEVSFFPF